MTQGQRRTGSLGAMCAVVLVGVFGLSACGSDDTDTATGQGDGDTTDETTETTSDITGGDGVDSETVQVGTELCEAFGAVQEPGGVDAILDLLTEDVVLSDVVLGADLTGKEQVRAYLTSEAFEGIDSNECGAMVRRGSWGAGAYTLSNSETGAGGSGIVAVHVTDGLVDRQVVHYTQNEADAPAPPKDTVTEGVGFDYCHAWDDGADADAILSYMTDEPTLVATEPVTGTEAVGTFIESFDFDENDCAEEGIEHGEWGAMANGFTNTTTGAGIEGVNVVRVENGKIAEHYVYIDPVG